MASKSFCDLPREIRDQVYEEVIPCMLDMHLMLTPPDPKIIIKKTAERKLQMIPEGETRIDQPCDECTELANDAATLMQTCKLIRTELGPRFYQAARFELLELPAAVRFVKNLPKDLLFNIIQLSLARPRDSYSSEKTEKRQSRTLIQGLPNLRQFRWMGVDRIADPDKKGTEWKP